MKTKPPFPGIRVTANGNQLVSYHTETRIADAGIFYPRPAVTVPAAVPGPVQQIVPATPTKQPPAVAP